MGNKSTSSHKPVLLQESLKALAIEPGGRYVDCTVGGGGHAAAILEKSAPGGQLLGIDADPNALEAARERLQDYKESALLVNDNFGNLRDICLKYKFYPVHGILLDLGLSSLQLGGDRGFSFQNDTPLDMRFDPNQKVSAADIVNESSESKLAQIIRAYGEESQSYRIARSIINERPITSTLQLAQIIEKAVGRRGKIHPATKTFQALRIAVNHELEHLESVLKQALDLLGYGGRLVVISYHSLEDRIVKQFMQQEAKGCICPPRTPICICGHNPRLKLINRKVIIPTEMEIKNNPRSRSAKLRAAESTATQSDGHVAGDSHDFVTIAKSTNWQKLTLMQKSRIVLLAG